MVKSVDLVVKARDEASRKFGIIGVSSKVMGTALKATARSIRWSFTRAFAGISAAAKMAFRGIAVMARRTLRTIKTTLRRIALGIAAIFTYSTYAAMKQQAAEAELASALKMAGTYSDALMEKLKQQASEIQKDTVYGDEYVLTLMRMAKTLGWTEDKLADAAKAAIALHAGFGGGRGKPEIFLRYYTDAINGTAKSLDTYIGELRKAKTEEERQIILQKNIAKGWDVAKSKTDSASGALKQMINAIGDAAEAFGGPFLADVTRTAKAVTKWAEDNHAAIALFAEKVHSYMTLVKDLFVAYINFMKEDWKEGFSKSLGAAIVLLKAFGQSVKIVFKKIFMNIGANIITWVKQGLAQKIEYERLIVKYQSEMRGKRIGGLHEKPLTQEIIEESKRRAKETLELNIRQGVFDIAYPEHEIIWEKAGSDITKTFRDALDQIKDIMPEFAKGVEKAFAENKARLEALKKEPAPPGKITKPPVEEEPKTFLGNLASAVRQKLQAQEARFLTFAPGTQFNYQKVMAENTAKEVTLTSKIVDATKQQVEIAKETLTHIVTLTASGGINITQSNFL